eukprot:TRINITY_DN20113_c0_g1_i4.p3 TRINITY_DN20113_c0_g1~~TRINITY_DN20113_c0_g1_i4.p3  ORF type:complete len:188 (+),score=30.26 TRINITY_DN20113_c0_g1_i4:178-741(+)
MFVALLVATLVFEVTCYPGLYIGCFLPEESGGFHRGIVKGFADNGFSLRFQDMEGNKVDGFEPNGTYQITVAGPAVHRTILFASNGEYLDNENVRPFPCGGRRLDFNDYLEEHTAIFVVGNSGQSEVLIEANVAGNCFDSYIQESVVVPIGTGDFAPLPEIESNQKESYIMRALGRLFADFLNSLTD